MTEEAATPGRADDPDDVAAARLQALLRVEVPSDAPPRRRRRVDLPVVVTPPATDERTTPSPPPVLRPRVDAPPPRPPTPPPVLRPRVDAPPPRPSPPPPLPDAGRADMDVTFRNPADLDAPPTPRPPTPRPPARDDRLPSPPESGPPTAPTPTLFDLDADDELRRSPDEPVPEPTGSGWHPIIDLAATTSVEVEAEPTVETRSIWDTPLVEDDSGVTSDDDDGASRRPISPAARTAILVVLATIGVVLAVVGANIVRSSTEGRLIELVDDPTAPGYEALVEPTPTMALFHTVDGSLNTITVLTLPDENAGGGGVIFIPIRTVADLGILGVSAIENSYNLGEPEFTRGVAGELVSTGIDEYSEVDASRWAQLVEPVAPLVVENPSNVRITLLDGSRKLLYEAGDVELSADEVGDYLEARDDQESDLARLFRHRLFWEAWLDAVAASDRPDVVPGETDQGLGRFVRALARGERVIETLPVRESGFDIDQFGQGYEYRPDETAELMAPLVPLPTSSFPGERVRVRVLNGTEETVHATTAALQIPPVGAEIVILGNAPRLNVETTTISYFGDDFRDEARAIARVLGVGVVEASDIPTEVADITVTLGADFPN